MIPAAFATVCFLGLVAWGAIGTALDIKRNWGEE